MNPPFEYQAFKALTPQRAVKLDRSRCVRHRCNRNACTRCIDVCHAEVFSWNEHGLQVAAEKCTQCLCCVSVCPTSALQHPELTLLQILSDLASQPDPIIGCTVRPETKAHARFQCLGLLSDPEQLLLMALVFEGGLKLNMIACHDCLNSHIRELVKGAVENVARIIPGHKLMLVDEDEDLDYIPSEFSRRELFGLFRKRSTRTAAAMVERLQVASQRGSYGSKQIPLKRAALLKAMEHMPAEEKGVVAEILFGDIRFTETCTSCGGCVGVCPTGAVSPADEESTPPIFKRHSCVTCGSCEAFCCSQGVQLTKSGEKWHQ